MSKAITITMVKDRTTKNTVRFREVGDFVIGTAERPGTLYLQKSAGFSGSTITVTIQGEGSSGYVAKGTITPATPEPKAPTVATNANIAFDDDPLAGF